MAGRECRVAEGVECRGVLGDEVADDDAHGTRREEFAGGVVIRSRNGESVARGELVAAGLEKSDYWD